MFPPDLPATFHKIAVFDMDLFCGSVILKLVLCHGVQNHYYFSYLTQGEPGIFLHFNSEIKDLLSCKNLYILKLSKMGKGT